MFLGGGSFLCLWFLLWLGEGNCLLVEGDEGRLGGY